MRPPFERSARRILTKSGLQYATHNHFVHLTGIQPRAFDGRAHGDRAELRRGEWFERPLKFADGGACGADDDRGLHYLITPTIDSIELLPTLLC